jgi:hypothetical protein
MKILITTTIAKATAFDTVAQTITVEGVSWSVFDLLPLAKSYSMSQVTGATNTVYQMFLNVPFKVQAAAYSGSVSCAITIIDDSQPASVRNLVTATINRFVGGYGYLINYTSGVVTNCVPTQTSVAPYNSGVIAGLTVFASPRYMYTASDATDVLGGTSISVIQFTADIMQITANERASQIKKSYRTQGFLRSSQK